MAGLDQRLTVFADGRVQLNDRKARGGAEILATSEEIATLTARLDSVPAERWRGRLGAIAHALLPHHHEAMRFELRIGARSIGGVAGRADADLAPLLAALDGLLARAVRERRG